MEWHYRSESLACSFTFLPHQNIQRILQQTCTDENSDVLSAGAQLSLYQMKCKNGLVVTMACGEWNDDEASDGEPEEPPMPVISHRAAVDAFGVCMDYLEQQEDTPSVQLVLLSQLMSEV